MAEIKRINAVFLYVADMAVMRNFYENTLKLGKPVVETDLWVEYELEGSNLALHQGDPRVLAQHDATTNTIRFSLETDDLESLHRELAEQGVAFSFAPRTDFGSYLAELMDPEGNLIRVIQYRM